MINPNLSHSQWPKKRSHWQVIADGFMDKWHVPNCLGAVVQKRVQVICEPETDWMFVNPTSGTSDPHFILNAIADATYHIYSVSADFPGALSSDNDDLLKTINLGRPDFPIAQPPFTFLGHDQLKPQECLRLPSGAKDEEEQQEILQGLRPAEVALELLMQRFSILRAKIPVIGFDRTFVTCLSIACLHNYFLDHNPEYAKDVVQLTTVREGERTPGTVKVSIPKYSFDLDKEWMDRMHMDEGTFQYLLSLTRPHLLKTAWDLAPELRLRVALRFMAMGTGFDSKVDSLFLSTYAAIDSALEEYASKVGGGEGDEDFSD